MAGSAVLVVAGCGPGTADLVGRAAEEFTAAVAAATLGLVVPGLFVASGLTRSIAGRSTYDNERLNDFQDPVTSWC